MDIILVLIVGSVVLGLEFFLPSFGTLSIMAALCYGYAIYLAFSSFGLIGGLCVSVLCVAIVAIAIALWVKYFPKMKLTKSISLDTQATPIENEYAKYVGKRGNALTDMAPLGKVSIDGTQYEAQSTLGFIEKGSLVEVESADNFKLIVKKLEK